jgi:hypothetical protein
MRAEYTLALRRESEEFEHAMVEQRVEQAFDHVYEALVPASNDLRKLLEQNKEALHLFEQIEHAYVKAIESAARSGIGCQVVRRDSLLRGQHAHIPLAAKFKPVVATATVTTADHDQVINVRPCG